MKVQRLSNPQQIAAKFRIQNTLPQATKNEALLSRKFKDLELGYETENIETRSNAELLNDRQYIYKELREKLNVLFGNDGNEIDEYIAYVADRKISLSTFNEIYPELLKLGRPLLARNVITKSNILLENIRRLKGDLNVPQVMEAIKQAKLQVQAEYNAKRLSKPDGDDLTDQLSALGVYAGMDDASQIQAIGNNHDIKRTLGQLIPVIFSNDKSQQEKVFQIGTILDTILQKGKTVKPPKPRNKNTTQPQLKTSGPQTPIGSKNSNLKTSGPQTPKKSKQSPNPLSNMMRP